MDFMIDKLTGIMDRFAGKIPAINVPWDKLSEYMNVINPYLAQINVIFPIDTLLQILVIYAAIRAAMFVIWTLVFIRRMLPF